MAADQRHSDVMKGTGPPPYRLSLYINIAAMRTVCTPVVLRQQVCPNAAVQLLVHGGAVTSLKLTGKPADASTGYSRIKILTCGRCTAST